MEPSAREAYSTDHRDEIFARLGIPFTAVRDLDGFENFVYRFEDTIIRVTHDSHRTPRQLLGELEFVNHLAEGGAAVARPLRWHDNEWYFSVGGFHVCRFGAAPGERLSYDTPFSPALIRAWGSAIGSFHRLASTFEPMHRRQDWQADENHDFRKRIPAGERDVIEAGEALLEQLGGLSQASDGYGLIHSDAHAGNFYRDGNALTFFDFDDCLYTWFGYDLGTILFSAAYQAYVEDSDEARREVVQHFLQHFLAGYRQEHSPSALLLDHMQRFIALREFSQYAVIHAHMDVNNLAPGLAKKFYGGFRRRFAEGRPMVDIDFGRYT